MKRWCLGFIFNATFDKVLLLRKGRTLHVGLWNGVGGNLAVGEPMCDAMVRECQEETELRIYRPFWQGIGSIFGPRDLTNLPTWEVGVFATWINPVTPHRFDDASVMTENDKPAWVALSNTHKFSLAPHAEIFIQESRRHLLCTENERSTRQPIEIHETHPL